MDQVKVVDTQGNTLLACSLEERERAWEYCRQLEEMGVAATIEAPTLPESLALSLGMAQKERQGLRESIDFEIAGHL